MHRRTRCAAPARPVASARRHPRDPRTAAEGRRRARRSGWTPGGGRFVTATDYWSSPYGPGRVLVYLRNHPPRGAQAETEGSGSGGPSIEFDWPHVPKGVWSASVILTMVKSRGGSTIRGSGRRLAIRTRAVVVGDVRGGAARDAHGPAQQIYARQVLGHLPLLQRCGVMLAKVLA
ncbi:MAG: hypothetical protein ACRDPE_02270 [Solirubrobacterales bacterium]